MRACGVYSSFVDGARRAFVKLTKSKRDKVSTTDSCYKEGVRARLFRGWA